jgi:hypothetical protein
VAGNAGTLETIAQQIGLALQPLESELTADNIIPFLAELGLQFPPSLLTSGFKTALNAGASAAGQLPAVLSRLATDISNGNESGILQDGEDLIQQISAVRTALQQIGAVIHSSAASFPGMDPAEVASFGAGLAENLIGYLLVSYLENIEPGVVGIANLLGVIDYLPHEAVPGDPAHPAFITRRLQLSSLGPLFNSPEDFLKTLYQWGSPSFDGTSLIPRVNASLNLLGFPSAIVPPLPPKSLTSSLLTLKANPATTPPGLLGELTETFQDGINLTLPLTSTWSVQIQVQGTFSAGLSATLTPPGGLSLKPSGVLNGLLQMNLKAQTADSSQPLILLGETGGSHVGAGSVDFGAGITVTFDSAAGTASAVPLVQFQVKKGTVLIDVSHADGFLADVIGSTPIQATFDVTATWRPDTGLHFEGGAQVEIDLPLHLNLGPVTLQTLYLAGGADSTGIPLEVSLALGVSMGPFQASVDRVGVSGHFSFPDQGGNLGPADLQIGFKPPSGLGLEIDMGLAAGGGFLSFDPAKGQYAGVLQVSLVDVVQVTAIGVLDTILPDGSSGFSLLLIISFNFPPIQLGFGFTLNGVSGLGGVNRTMSLDTLQAGFRAHTLNLVLSPPNPIENAPQIISSIRSFFPVAEGRYLFGPLLTIGWGTPAIVTLSLAVLLEVPDPIRIVILGLIDAGLPDKDDALLQLHIEVLGMIDFGTQTLSIDGRLYDSSLLVYSLTGDLAFRLAWGANPNFIFSVGGFNPHFNTDGLNVPALRRMSLSIGDGDNPRISSNSYFAVTSNSVQFGANVQAFASAGGFNIQGYLGFDVLIVLSPFSFEFDFSASFDVTFEGTTLAGLTVKGTLFGPTPWHLHGSASISFLFFSVSASLDLTWGSSTQATIPQQAVLPDLFNALKNPANWSAALPPGNGPSVTLTTPDPGSQTLLVHPMGTLRVKETVTPLDLAITRYGSAAPADGTQFSIVSVQMNGKSETIQSVQDYFAPGQFLTLSDADRLGSPAFELYDAGVDIGSTAVLTGQDSARTVTYNEIYIDDPAKPSRFSRIYQMSAGLHLALSQQGAGFASPAKNTGLGKYRGNAYASPISVRSVNYAVASAVDLSARSDIASAAGLSYHQAQAALAGYLVTHPEEAGTLQILPLHEVAA